MSKERVAQDRQVRRPGQGTEIGRKSVKPPPPQKPPKVKPPPPPPKKSGS